MRLEDAVSVEGVRRVLDKLFDRFEAHADRVRPPTFILDGDTMPEFGPRRREGQAENTWAGLTALRTAGLIELEHRRPPPGKAEYEMNPRVRFVPAAEEQLRKLISRPRPGPSRSALWREALQLAFPGELELQQALAGNWIEVEGHSTQEVASRLPLLRQFVPGSSLRHVSAKLFWSDSKVLDGREALICAVLGVDECPFPESRVRLDVALPQDCITGVLLVENEATFDDLHSAVLLGRPALSGLAIVQTHGFRGAARRVRDRAGAWPYFAFGTDGRLQEAFCGFWYSDRTDIPVMWWGDLDYAGMAILKALRSVFPHATAWRPGYELMLQALQDGHSPRQAGKERQIDPATTGCPYADGVLLPAMRTSNRFVDQELIVLTPDGRAPRARPF
ncbi:MAG: Wadjet anti-phage system protein JetD domain-containing protein [Methanocella sp.]